MASPANELKEIREYDTANIEQGVSLENRILLLNSVFEEWVFTPNSKWDKILAMRTEDVRCNQFEV